MDILMENVRANVFVTFKHMYKGKAEIWINQQPGFIQIRMDIHGYIITRNYNAIQWRNFALAPFTLYDELVLLYDTGILELSRKKNTPYNETK